MQRLNYFEIRETKLYNLLYWLAGLLLCALGIALCTKANFGLSMIAAPPYILHLFGQQFLPWFSQGVSEYFWQGILLIIMCFIIRDFKWNFLLSYGAAILAGFAIDGSIALLGGPEVYETLWVRIIVFIAGEIIIAFAISCFFRTNWPVQVYELTVKEIASRNNWTQSSVKWIYDFSMLAIAILFCLFLTKGWQGVGIGTVVITIVNAPLIAVFSRNLDKIEIKLFPTKRKTASVE